MTILNFGTGETSAPKREALSSRDERLGQWLNDEDGPVTLSAMAIDGSARRQRALAEVDGMFAGLTYLNKLGDTQEDIGYDPTFPDLFRTSKESIFHSDITYPDLEEVVAQCAEEDIRTNEIRRAWSGLRNLRKGLEQQHDQLRGIAFEEKYSTKIQELLLKYTSPRRMGEIVSYVISNLLLQRGRIAETDVLSGLQRWGGCISNERDRHTFALLASKMWPLEHLRTANDIEKRSGQDDDQDSHYLRAKRSRLEDDDAPRPLGFQPFQSVAGQGSSSKEMRDAALLTSQGLEMLSEKSPTAAHDHQHSFGIENLGGDVMNITDQTSEEYDFSQLLSLLGDIHDSPVGPSQHNDTLFTSGIDPRSSDYYWSGLSLNQIPSQTFAPMNDPHTRPQSPSPAKDCPSISTDGPAVKQSMIKFKCFNRDSDTAIFRLRDTPMFLAVVAFAQDTGDVFYRLSGCGKTVHAMRRSSAYAKERSKAERRLRRDLFDPMKNSGEGNVEVIEPGREHEKFIRWIYGSSSFRPSSTRASAQPDIKTRQEQFPSAKQDA
ncbi:hypothetical protein CFIO01_07601 [Colletotrichum fioriniae PJ7]|uniref:Uncharacterized protein n=1 Tax=Colletotrichum fioriniae PJ7 TaxID=1445577 RepID=A0A010SMA2_9PEZI|nr:hypothetical protein CFIO01_07601 [Colletotrichum fioriniae PJ7]